MGIWQKRLGIWARWWNTQIKVNPTLVHQQKNICTLSAKLVSDQNCHPVIIHSALQLLDFCYHLDDDLTQHLLTASLDNWSRKTCLSLAVIAQNLK